MPTGSVNSSSGVMSPARGSDLGDALFDVEGLIRGWVGHAILVEVHAFGLQVGK